MTWGRNDQGVTANSTTTKATSNGAPIGTWALVKKGGNVTGAPGSANAHMGNTSPGSRANVDSNMFGNTTVGAFIQNMAVGVFGVSAKMEDIVDSPLVDAQVRFGGSGYLANAAVTLNGGGGGSGGVINAHANATTGKIDALNISAIGSAYKGVVTLSIAAPTGQTFNSNTSTVSAQTFNSNTSLYNQVTFNGNTAVTANVITIVSQPFSVGDVVKYTTGASNAAIGGLANATNYYVVLANSTVVSLSATAGGPQIALTPTATVGSTGEFLTHYNFFATGGANPFANGTVLQYTVAAGNTVIVPLANGTNYYVTKANSTGFSLSNTVNGAVVNVTPGVSETGHNLTRYSFISIAGSVWQTGDKATYTVAAGNTAISPLSNGTQYFIAGANTTGFFLANSFLYKTGSWLNLVPGVTETGHTLTGETATGNVTLGGSYTTGGVSHAGWVIRREGTGGRAGRVHYETLVAMGSLGAQTAPYGTPALVANASGIANTIFPSNN